METIISCIANRSPRCRNSISACTNHIMIYRLYFNCNITYGKAFTIWDANAVFMALYLNITASLKSAIQL